MVFECVYQVKNLLFPSYLENKIPIAFIGLQKALR